MPTPGLATASTAAAGNATVSTSVPEVPTSVPDIPSPSSQLAVEEELEVVSGRQLFHRRWLVSGGPGDRGLGGNGESDGGCGCFR